MSPPLQADVEISAPRAAVVSKEGRISRRMVCLLEVGGREGMLVSGSGGADP
jgi:hypothetical protein